MEPKTKLKNDKDSPMISSSVIDSSVKRGRTYGGMTQEQRRQQRKEQFLETGLRVFGEQGYRAATVRGICREAGLTDRYFYECCGTLEQLLTDVYEHHMKKLMQNLNDVVTKQRDAERHSLINAVLDCFYTAMEDHNVAQVSMFEIEGVSPSVHKLYNGYIRQFTSLPLLIGKHLYPKWPFSDEESEIIGHALVGGIIQITRNWILNDYKTDKATLVQSTWHLFEGVNLQVEQQIKLLNDRQFQR